MEWVGDTESSKNTSLVQRLIREKERPIADVFWSSENIGTLQLATEGILTSHKSNVTESWPEQYQDPAGLWFAFSPRARVIAYNPVETSRDEIPEYWWNFTDAAMADPRFGTTGTHLAVMASDDERFSLFVQGLRRKPLLGGNAATVRRDCEVCND